MDIQRPDLRKRRLIRNAIIAGVMIVAGAGLAYGLLKLKPAAMAVDRNGLLIGTVQRGSFVREVRGVGSLVPIKIVVVAANVEGRVVNRHVLAGAPLDSGTPMFEIANPKLQQDLFEAQSQLQAATADLANLKAQLEGQLLQQRSTTAQVRSDYEQAQAQHEANQKLQSYGLIDAISTRKSEVAATQLRSRVELETQRIDVNRQTMAAQLAAQQSRIEQARSLVHLRQQQLADLQVHSGIQGVLQSVDVEVGAYVTPGTVLARVSDPRLLKAQIRIPETLAKDILFNQKAVIDTHNGTLQGHVVRIDPAVKEGSVTIDIELDGPLPAGARPDLSVEAVIRLETVNDVLHTGRMSEAQQDATASLFRLEPGDAEAVRVPVRLGRLSVSDVEILTGLREGDRVIVSDTSSFRDAQRIRIR